MTEQNDNHDPLGDALRNEVPAPGPGYWDSIDARLEAAAAERSAENVIHLDHLEKKADTAEPVIRLTGMNTQTPSPTNSPRNLVLAIAAVAALIVGVVGFTALRDNGQSTVEFAEGTAEGTPEIDGNADDSTETPAEPEPTPTTDAPDADDAPPVDDEPTVSVDRRCFFEQYLPEDEPDPTVVWIIEIDGDTFRSLIESPGPDGTTNRTFDTGTVDADGVGTTSAGIVIDFDDTGASRSNGEFEPFTAAAVDCADVTDYDGMLSRLAEIRTAAADAPPAADEPAADDGEQAAEETPEAGNPILELPFHETLIGMTEEAAQAATEDAGYIWRVTARDDEMLIVTQDFSEHRINAAIVDGIVTATNIG